MTTEAFGIFGCMVVLITLVWAVAEWNAYYNNSGFPPTNQFLEFNQEMTTIYNSKPQGLKKVMIQEWQYYTIVIKQLTQKNKNYISNDVFDSVDNKGLRYMSVRWVIIEKVKGGITYTKEEELDFE